MGSKSSLEKEVWVLVFISLETNQINESYRDIFILSNIMSVASCKKTWSIVLPSDITKSVKDWFIVLIHWGYSVKLHLDGNRRMNYSSLSLAAQLAIFHSLIHGQFNQFSKDIFWEECIISGSDGATFFIAAHMGLCIFWPASHSAPTVSRLGVYKMLGGDTERAADPN